MDNNKDRFYDINNKIVFPITEILEKTTILNASLGLKDYSIENYQKKAKENIELFIVLLDKYIPNWVDAYYCDSKIQILKCISDPDKLQRDIQMYRDQGAGMLQLLTSHIMSPAVQLRNQINEYKKEKEYAVSEIMDDVTEILAQLGMPRLLFYAHCRMYCVG